jgi:hypothetical protein
MSERALWSLGTCTAIGVLLAACQLNDTDSAPPAPSEPSTSAAQAGTRGGGDEQSGDDETPDSGAEDSGAEDSGAEDTPPPPNGSSDAGAPAFPGLDAGNSPPTLTLDASTLLPVLDASDLLPDPLPLQDSGSIGAIDSGLASFN